MLGRKVAAGVGPVVTMETQASLLSALSSAQHSPPQLPARALQVSTTGLGV